MMTFDDKANKTFEQAESVGRAAITEAANMLKSVAAGKAAKAEGSSGAAMYTKARATDRLAPATKFE